MKILGLIRKDIAISFPDKVQNTFGTPLAAGTYTIGSGGYFPTIDSAFNKLSIDGIAGQVILELIDNLFPKISVVSLKVYDILGNELQTRIKEEKSAGNYKLNWTASNLPSGVYFYRLQARSFIDTKKMILLK